MKNAPSFLGYSRLAAEITASRPDQREQIDLSTPHPVPAIPPAPLHHNLLAPNMWPAPAHLPRFRPVFEEYISRMSALSMDVTALIAQAVGLPPDAFAPFFDADQQHKLKIVKYPETPAPPADAEAAAFDQIDARGNRRAQGVGPHKDSMLSSYLLQASPHLGLQVQNVAGEWVDVPPRERTLVVAIGQGMEALTRGVCASTTHRVLSPLPGEGARFSVPFFQGVSLDARFDELDRPDGVGARIPEAVRTRHGGRLDDVEFTFRRGGRSDTLGEATLRNRVKSHQDVAERWYPELLADHLADLEKEKERARAK
jgi:isopenicillin N synthase-like dioxygenase